MFFVNFVLLIDIGYCLHFVGFLIHIVGMSVGTAKLSNSSFRFVILCRCVARKSQWGAVLGVWGQSPQSLGKGPKAWAKPPAAGGTWVWEWSPQRSKILLFFAKIAKF